MEYARAYLGKHAPEASRLMIPRFYCSFPLAPGAVVELPAEAAHHAVKVLRLSAGDTVILFDGRGGQWQARLAPAGKSVRAVLEAFEDTEREAPVKGIQIRRAS